MFFFVGWIGVCYQSLVDYGIFGNVLSTNDWEQPPIHIKHYHDKQFSTLVHQHCITVLSIIIDTGLQSLAVADESLVKKLINGAGIYIELGNIAKHVYRAAMLWWSFDDCNNCNRGMNVHGKFGKYILFDMWFTNMYISDTKDIYVNPIKFANHSIVISSGKPSTNFRVFQQDRWA